MKKLLIVTALISSLSALSAQPTNASKSAPPTPTATMGPAMSAPAAQPSEDEMRRLNAGVSYLQQVDPEIRAAYEAYNRSIRETQLRNELAQSRLDEVLYGKIKAFDATIGKAAEIRLQEAKQRRKAAEDELAKISTK